MQVDFRYIAFDTLIDIIKDEKLEPETKEKKGVGDVLYTCLRKSNSGFDIDTVELSKLREVSDKEFYEIFEKARKYEQGE